MTLHVHIRWLMPFVGIILFLYPGFGIGATVEYSHVDGVPSPTLLQEYSVQYFLDRSIQFTKDMTVGEFYLSGLTETVIKEIKARKKEGSLMPSVLVNHTWADLPSFTPFNSSFTDRRINIAYPAWEKSQLEAYFRSMVQVQEIRGQLISSAAPFQKLRMFREEYRQGLKAYTQERWQSAALWFDGILESYEYRTVDDVIFYRSEAFLELGFLYQAYAGYHELVASYPESHYWEDALVRAFMILDELNQSEPMKHLYQEWEPQITKTSTATQDIIHFRMCRVSFLEGDYDQTIYHATLMSPVTTGRDQIETTWCTNTLLASAWALKGDYGKAIPVLENLLTETRGRTSLTDVQLKDEIRIRLAFICFQQGDYAKSLELNSQVSNDSPSYPMALLGQAWVYFHQNDFLKTLELTKRLLAYYPQNKNAYEASCLLASAEQTSVAPDLGSDLYQSVMNDAMRNWRLEGASLEREQLLITLNKVRGLEEAVFLDGHTDLFEQYLRTRSSLMVLSKRFRVWELWEADEGLHPILEEQQEMVRVARELHDLSYPLTSKDLRYRTQSGRLQEKIDNLSERLINLQLMKMRTTPVFYSTYRSRADLSDAFSLLSQSHKELSSLQNDLMWMKDLSEGYNRANASGYSSRFQCELVGIGITRSLNELDTKRTILGEEIDKDLINQTPTHLNEWAEFGFRRIFMSGGLFNRYTEKLSRNDDLNQYLNTINQLLSTPGSVPAPGESNSEIMEPKDVKP